MNPLIFSFNVYTTVIHIKETLIFHPLRPNTDGNILPEIISKHHTIKSDFIVYLKQLPLVFYLLESQAPAFTGFYL